MFCSVCCKQILDAIKRTNSLIIGRIFHFLFSIRRWGSCKMSLVVPEYSGYSERILKAASQGGKTHLYFSQIQEELNTASLPLADDAFSRMPKAMCHRCNDNILLQFLTEDIKSCDSDMDKNYDKDSNDNKGRTCNDF